MIGLFSYYISWHYSKALSDIFRHIKNFLWFLYNFFSIPLLFKTLFDPFQRLEEHYKGGLHPADMASVITINLIMRLVGLVVRLVMMIFGALVLLAALILSVVWVVLWVILPLLLLVLLLSGIRFLFI